ncbi:MAG: hypothetical protein RL591_2332 [Planctomycetota bacterium]
MWLVFLPTSKFEALVQRGVSIALHSMLHNLPHFSDVLAHENSVRCMLVRSGTSRVLLLDGTEIKSGKVGLEQIRRVMLGADNCGGYGGRTSQDNKVAIVWPVNEEGVFRYKFLQVVAQSGAILPMECSNSASASAMMAQFSTHPDNRHNLLRATNLSTAQKVELRPSSREGVASAWHIRFLADKASREALSGLGSSFRVSSRGRSIQINPVFLGNLFLFSEIHPSEVDREMAEIIAKEGLAAACNAGWTAPEDYEPKVIPFHTPDVRERAVETASFYHGELHRSMPGSAAMALASFLEVRGSQPKSKTPRWTVHHSSGAFEVRLGLSQSAGEREIAWTEFTTPVRLLGWGVAALGSARRKR